MQTVQTENEQKKEYLKGYRIHSRRVNRIESEIEEIRSMKIYIATIKRICLNMQLN